MSELTDAELKRLIATLAKEKPRSSLGLQYPHTAKIAAQKRKLAKRLEPFFVKAGFDVDGINEVLTQNQNELREILAKPSAREKKVFAKAEKAFHRGIANKRKALEYLRKQVRPPTVNYITLDKPFYVWAHDAGIVVDTHIESWNSWAKVLWHIISDDYTDYQEELRFYFLWTNPSNSMVVINIDTSLMFQGHIAMMGNGHIFIPGFAILVGDVELNVSQWGGNSTTSPPPSEAHWTRIIVNKDIQGDSYFRPGDFGGVFDLVYDYDLQIKNFAVPAHANVLFQVSTSWATGTSDFGGNIYVDFANDDHKIMCPYVALEVLGEASGNVGLGT